MPDKKKISPPKCLDIVTAILQLKKRWLKIRYTEKERHFMVIAEMAARWMTAAKPDDIDDEDKASK